MRLRRPSGPLGAGARDTWVTIQAADDGDSGSGFPTEVWTDLARVAMAREDLEAVEIDRQATPMALSTIRWVMPYRTDMDPERVDVPKERRLVLYERIYDIIAAAPFGPRRTYLELVTVSSSKTPSEATP